jgi:hypothetical protein
MGKTYFDAIHDSTRYTDTVTVQPKATYIYSTILDQPLTVEMIQSAQIIHPYQFEIPIHGDKTRLRVELKDGTNWIVNFPGPTSDAGKELMRTSTRINEILGKWVKEGWGKELQDLKWEVFAKDQMELTDDRATAVIFDRDLVTRRTKNEIQQKLMSEFPSPPTYSTTNHCTRRLCLFCTEAEFLWDSKFLFVYLLSCPGKENSAGRLSAESGTSPQCKPT